MGAEIVALMPARNAERFIATAIRSTLRALGDRGSIVVVDDGSTDSTSSVVSSFPSEKVRLIRNETSVGSGRARQMALQATDSMYVANMDADDVCFPWRFTLQQELILKYDVVFGGAIPFRVWPPRVELPVMTRMQPEEADVLLPLANLFSHSSALMRRSTLDEVGGYRHLKRGQDYDLWLRVACAGGLIYRSALPVVGYRLSDGQISRQSSYSAHLAADSKLRTSREAFLATRWGVSSTQRLIASEEWQRRAASMGRINRWHARRLIAVRREQH